MPDSQGGAFVTTFLSQTSSATFEVALIFCGYLPTTHLGLVSRIDAAVEALRRSCGVVNTNLKCGDAQPRRDAPPSSKDGIAIS